MSKYLDEQEKLKNMTNKEKREYINQKANKQKKKKKTLKVMAICLCFVFLIGLVTVSKYSITQLKYKNIRYQLLQILLYILLRKFLQIHL